MEAWPAGVTAAWFFVFAAAAAAAFWYKVSSVERETVDKKAR